MNPFLEGFTDELVKIAGIYDRITSRIAGTGGIKPAEAHVDKTKTDGTQEIIKPGKRGPVPLKKPILPPLKAPKRIAGNRGGNKRLLGKIMGGREVR